MSVDDNKAARKIFFFQLVDGKISRMTATCHPIEFMQQLGVPLPLSGTAP